MKKKKKKKNAYTSKIKRVLVLKSIFSETKYVCIKFQVSSTCQMSLGVKGISFLPIRKKAGKRKYKHKMVNFQIRNLNFIHIRQ